MWRGQRGGKALQLWRCLEEKPLGKGCSYRCANHLIHITVISIMIQGMDVTDRESPRLLDCSQYYVTQGEGVAGNSVEVDCFFFVFLLHSIRLCQTALHMPTCWDLHSVGEIPFTLLTEGKKTQKRKTRKPLPIAMEAWTAAQSDIEDQLYFYRRKTEIHTFCSKQKRYYWILKLSDDKRVPKKKKNIFPLFPSRKVL